MEKIRTIISHYGENPQNYLGAITPPIFENSNFAFNSYEELEEFYLKKINRYIYTRESNPTIEILEEKIAKLENGESAKAFAAGVNAITSSILAFIKSGDHILAVKSLYNPTYEFLANWLNKFNIETTFFDVKDVENLDNFIKDNTKIIVLESPTSFLFEVLDLQKISNIAKKYGIITIIDNTWATPYFQNPIDFGIDIVVHSSSKYISGHSDIIGGLVISKEKFIRKIEKERELRGGNIGPFEAWLILRGLRTLPLRMETHQKNAIDVAKYLESQNKVVKVHYPALPSHPQHNLAKSQMRGFSGVFSFEIEGGEKEVRKFLNNLRLFKIAVSWGGYESLIFPGKFAFSKERKDNIRFPDNLLRISIGLEDLEDLIWDLETAFRNTYK